jgi:hypothetical protein
MRRVVTAAVLALGAVAMTPATAQLVGGGLVVVNVSNVANNIARDLDVNVSQIPVTVQAPISVAAAVCGLDVNVLAQQRQEGQRRCDATSNNAALNRIVQSQLVNQQ